MLRIHFLQHWFELSDPAAEEALYDSRAMRRFVSIDLGQAPVPDETTILHFRHLMEKIIWETDCLIWSTATLLKTASK